MHSNLRTITISEMWAADSGHVLAKSCRTFNTLQFLEGVIFIWNHSRMGTYIKTGQNFGLYWQTVADALEESIYAKPAVKLILHVTNVNYLDYVLDTQTRRQYTTPFNVFAGAGRLEYICECLP